MTVSAAGFANLREDAVNVIIGQAGFYFDNDINLNADVALVHPQDFFIQFENTADIFKGFNTRQLMTDQKIRVNPNYNLPSAFIDPRQLRIQVASLF